MQTPHIFTLVKITIPLQEKHLGRFISIEDWEEQGKDEIRIFNIMDRKLAGKKAAKISLQCASAPEA
jgi:hypothetical protein